MNKTNQTEFSLHSPKKIDFKIISIFLGLVIIFQLFFSFNSPNSFLSSLGQLQLVFAVSFVTFFFICRKATAKLIFGFIFIYQLLLVLLLFNFYVFTYSNPLGFQPIDAARYHQLGLVLQNKSFSSSIQHLLGMGDIGDLGFPLLLKFVYMLGGNEILNMKFFNIFFHLLTCFYIYKLTQLLDLDEVVSKYIIIFYGLNPISIYFNASGLKEPFFVLVVTICFYLLYKANIKGYIRYYLYGFVAILATGLFRAPFPVLIFMSFGIFRFLNAQGKYKYLIRIFILLITPLLFGVILFMVKDRLLIQIGVDRGASVAYRIGRTPGAFEYVLLAISGLIGPLPSFIYETDNVNRLLQTTGAFLKLILSYFFLIGGYKILKNKLQRFYPMLLFTALNIIMLTITAATFDYRFLYPFMPFYFIIIGYGVREMQQRSFSLVKYAPYLIFIVILIIGYNFRA